jgi:hypothetical protein
MAEFLAPSSQKKTTGHWSLDAPSHFDWRSLRDPKKNKNRRRDFYKWAASAFVEERLVKQYRKKLFEISAAAAFIRCRLADAFLSLVQPHPGPKRIGIVHCYVFPDGIELDGETEKSDLKFDVLDLVDNSDKTLYLNKAKRSITKLKKSINSFPYAKRTPGNTTIDPDVQHHATLLERVCGTFCFSISLLHFIQALIVNAYRLQKMSAFAADNDMDPEDIDPEDEEYAVDPSTIIGLPLIEISLPHPSLASPTAPAASDDDLDNKTNDAADMNPDGVDPEREEYTFDPSTIVGLRVPLLETSPLHPSPAISPAPAPSDEDSESSDEDSESSEEDSESSDEDSESDEKTNDSMDEDSDDNTNDSMDDARSAQEQAQDWNMHVPQSLNVNPEEDTGTKCPGDDAFLPNQEQAQDWDMDRVHQPWNPDEDSTQESSDHAPPPNQEQLRNWAERAAFVPTRKEWGQGSIYGRNTILSSQDASLSVLDDEELEIDKQPRVPVVRRGY